MIFNLRIRQRERLLDVTPCAECAAVDRAAVQPDQHVLVQVLAHRRTLRRDLEEQWARAIHC